MVAPPTVQAPAMLAETDMVEVAVAASVEETDKPAIAANASEAVPSLVARRAGSFMLSPFEESSFSFEIEH